MLGFRELGPVSRGAGAPFRCFKGGERTARRTTKVCGREKQSMGRSRRAPKPRPPPPQPAERSSGPSQPGASSICVTPPPPPPPGCAATGCGFWFPYGPQQPRAGRARGPSRHRVGCSSLCLQASATPTEGTRIRTPWEIRNLRRGVRAAAPLCFQAFRPPSSTCAHHRGPARPFP